MKISRFTSLNHLETLPKKHTPDGQLLRYQAYLTEGYCLNKDFSILPGPTPNFCFTSQCSLCSCPFGPLILNTVCYLHMPHVKNRLDKSKRYVIV